MYTIADLSWECLSIDRAKARLMNTVVVPGSMQPASLRWTLRDLDVLPDDGGWKRYEIIDGDLFVTRAPHFRHQRVATKLQVPLEVWSVQTGLGVTLQAPGLILSPHDAVIPDLVWISQERLDQGLDAAGHLIVAPEIVIEILSPGEQNRRRDREVKLKLYSLHGVQEYWIVSWQQQTLEIYRRSGAQLQLFKTLLRGDSLDSPLLPSFDLNLAQIFA